ncbi:MAG: glycosyltransferase family protein, partial [Promethearchaeota archaeon]
MTTIAYFISDHGFGHASRSIAIIRSLLNCDLDISINLHTSNPLGFVRNSLSSSEYRDRFDFHDMVNDFGFIKRKQTFTIDHVETAKEVHRWIQSWQESYLFDKFIYLKSKNVDLVISDISPQPFILAKKLDVPSIAISNFTWFDIYQNSSYQQDDLEKIWSAYRDASLGLLLPFNFKNEVFCSTFETNLVSRTPTRTREQMRKELDLGSSSMVVYTGTGSAMTNPFQKEWLYDSEIVYIIGSLSTIENENNTRKIPTNDYESQDFIACSDIALIKPGYSSVSEAVRSQIPIIGVNFPQTTESNLISKIIQELGIGII